LGIAVVLFFLELFLPSGGLLGLLAAAALIAGIVLLFMKNTTWGLVGALVTVVALPFVLGLALKLWPNTPIARWMTLRGDAGEDGGGAATAAGAAALVGRTGKAMTDLRPIGTVVLEGQRVECLAEAGIIRAGATVKVIAADGMN